MWTAIANSTNSEGEIQSECNSALLENAEAAHDGAKVSLPLLSTRKASRVHSDPSTESPIKNLLHIGSSLQTSWSSVPLFWQALPTVLSLADFFLHFGGTLEEGNSQQRRFAALPHEVHLLCRLRLNVLAQAGFQYVFVNTKFASALCVKVLVCKIVRVPAIGIADKAMRPGHDGERLHRSVALFLNRNVGECPIKKPTRQMLVGWDCEDSGGADQLEPQPWRFPTRLLDCRWIDKATTSAGCKAMEH